MESLIVMVNLFGAVALLLFGLSQVKEGVTIAFGMRLRSALATGTRGPLHSLASGFLATIALQSSTATSLMVASFTERGLMKPRMAQIVLLGANIGTAVTAWLVSTGIHWLSPLLILAGVALKRGSASGARQGMGGALIGVGLMLLSLHVLSAATDPFRESVALRSFLAMLDGAWPVAMIFAAVLAFLSSSSLAIVVLILSLSVSGVLTPGLTVALVLGANLGGAIPPVVATLAQAPAARRVTLGNLIVRSAGVVVALPLAGLFVGPLGTLPIQPAALPVDIHLAFNIAMAVFALPLSGPLARLTTHLVPEREQDDRGPRHLDEMTLNVPLMALSGASREVLRVGDAIEQMLVHVMHAFNRNDVAELAAIPSIERQVDRLQQDVKLFLSRLGRNGLSEEQSRRSIVIIDYAINLEHVGDIIEKGLSEQVRKKIGNGLYFSDEGFEELKSLFALTIDNLRIAQTIFITRDTALARQLMEIKVEIRRREKASSERHLGRLRDGRVESLQTSSLHLDMLRDLKRVNAHLVSVAHPILDEGGLLSESRLRAL